MIDLRFKYSIIILIEQSLIINSEMEMAIMIANLYFLLILFCFSKNIR